MFAFSLKLSYKSTSFFTLELYTHQILHTGMLFFSLSFSKLTILIFANLTGLTETSSRLVPSQISPFLVVV